MHKPNEEIELEFLNENNKSSILQEELSNEMMDSLDNHKLKSIIKAKCRLIKKFEDFEKLLNDEKEKNNQLETIIKFQKTEIKKNYKVIIELKNEIFCLRKNENVKGIDLQPMDIKKSYNYFNMNEDKKINIEINDLNNGKIVENAGESDVSFSSKREENHITKKWFYDEEKIAINFDDLKIKLTKNNESNTINFIQKEIKIIDVEISNISEFPILLNDLQVDSTESNFLLI